MVDSGKVTGDLSTLTSYLTNYSSYVGDLAANWKGPSYDNISSKAEEFANEYTSALSDGMTAFASACAKYVEYKATKDEISRLRDELANAKDEDKAAIEAQIRALEEKLQRLKAEIESFLAKASSVSLTASTVSIPTFSAVTEAQKKN